MIGCQLSRSALEKLIPRRSHHGEVKGKRKRIASNFDETSIKSITQELEEKEVGGTRIAG